MEAEDVANKTATIELRLKSWSDQPTRFHDP
jgi:hypothetical protein